MITRVRYCVGHVAHPRAVEHSQSVDITFTAVAGDRCCVRCPVVGSAHRVTVKQP